MSGYEPVPSPPADASSSWDELRKIAAAEIAAGEIDKAARVGEHMTQFEAELIAEREMRRVDQEARQRLMLRSSAWPEA